MYQERTGPDFENPENIILQKAKNLTIKLVIGSEVSTGVIYSPGQDHYIYIFTALHSLRNFTKRRNTSVTISYFNNGDVRQLEILQRNLEFLTLSELDEDGLPNYTACEGTAKDIAVLRISKDYFNQSGFKDIQFPPLLIASSEIMQRTSNFFLYGAGYPNDAPAPIDLTAVINAFLKEEGRYHLKCTVKEITQFETMMHGHSGGGLYISSGKELLLVCLTTGCRENEANNHFFAVPPYDLLDQMKKNNWPVPEVKEKKLPESLTPFFTDTAGSFFDPDFNRLEYEILKKGLQDLHKSKDSSSEALKAECFFPETKKDPFHSCTCEDCNREAGCRNYWSGQLIKAFCFCRVNGEKVTNLRDLYYNLPGKKHPEKVKKIRIEFVCSNKKAADFVRHLLDQKFNIDGHQLEENTIFIWNGNKMWNKASYNAIYNRGSINNILRDVIQIPGTNELSAAGREKLMGTNYNIVDGDIPYFNYAMIGTEKLADSVIRESAGKYGVMRENLTTTMAETWKKKN